MAGSVGGRVSPSLIYRGAGVYELAMLALYGRHYSARYRALADLIAPSSSVLDVCCGPGVLYDRYLRAKAVHYTGLDLNEKFIRRLNARGGHGLVWDLRKPRQLPKADFVIMQASLYHFLPDPTTIVDGMLQAARARVIIAEPIRNLVSSKSRVLARVGRSLTKVNDTEESLRFTEESADKFFAAYASRLSKSFLISGGREKVYVLEAVKPNVSAEY